MEQNDLVKILSQSLDKTLANDLVNEFSAIRNDCITGTFGRSSPGKFIETIVQVMQFLDNGSFDEKPNVDSYLKNLESQQTNLNDGLKLCCARIARSCYTLRNKRNILHKGTVDPNIYDLRYLYHASQWILSEIVRELIKQDMKVAGTMIEFIQLPVSSIIEDFGDRKIIYGNFTIEEEILVLLHSHYPEFVSVSKILHSLDRRSKTAVYKSLNNLWKNKDVHKDNDYKITQKGFRRTIELIKNNSVI